MGFGRWSKQQAQATPDKVPLTNIAFIDGVPLEPEKIHQGYIINSTGVEVGLTQDNTRDFAQTQLSASKCSPAVNDWEMVNMTISVNGSVWNNGQALFDTGIDYSFVKLDAETTSHMNTSWSPNKPHHPRRRVLSSNSIIDVQIADIDPRIIEYRVNNSDTENAVRPYDGEFVLEIPSMTPAFINTGRYFYRGFSAMLDVECGLFGLKRKRVGGEEDTFSFSPGLTVQNSQRLRWE